MQAQPISFDFALASIVFWPETPENEFLRKAMEQVVPLRFQMSCAGSKNSYQLISGFDQVLKDRLESNGHASFQLRLPAGFRKDYDFVLRIGQSNVVFEVEKANFEKIFYDLFKAHVYLQSGADHFVLMLPLAWGHSLGEKDLFAIACERIKQSRHFGFGKPEVFDRLLVIGFEQHFEGEPFGKDARERIRDACKTHFSH